MPDPIMWIKHLKVTCAVNALDFPINVSSPVTSFSLDFSVDKVSVDVMLFFFLCLHSFVGLF